MSPKTPLQKQNIFHAVVSVEIFIFDNLLIRFFFFVVGKQYSFRKKNISLPLNGPSLISQDFIKHCVYNKGSITWQINTVYRYCIQVNQKLIFKYPIRVVDFL